MKRNTITNPISKTRKKLINNKNKSDFKVDEVIYVKYSALNYISDKSDRNVRCIIIKIINDNLIVKNTEYHNDIHTISQKDVVERDIYKIGINPFDEKLDRINTVNYSLESILFNLNILGEKSCNYNINGIPIMELNWNPFIFDKEGKKIYYQRPFVWSINDKQLLIESIYQEIECGKILVRKRGWGELEKLQANGETELSFNDIIDGKQRLNAIKEFIECKYPDANGNYYGDLSFYSQNKFIDHQLLSFATMPENTKDIDVIHQFLKLNFTGVPQSKEHIEFVKSLQNKI